MEIAKTGAQLARAGSRESVPRSTAIADWWALTKPDVNLLIVTAALAGFCLGDPPDAGRLRWFLLLHTLVGTWLVGSGAGVLNQYVERRFDAQMRRTARRPVAAGRIAPVAAQWVGMALSGAGALYLAAAVNTLASLLAIVAFVSYLFLYTPLKRKTPLCTLVGAFAGAVPPLIGWAAASRELSLQAWTLYAIVFCWQFPHVMAIAWLYRDDYARAHFGLIAPMGPYIAWISSRRPARTIYSFRSRHRDEKF